MNLYGLDLTPLFFVAEFQLNFGVLTEENRIPFILNGILVTLQFVLLSAVVGFIWGTILSLFKISKFQLLRVLSEIYTSIFRGTPLLVSLTLIYYAIPQLTDYDITALQAGVITFGLNSAAYISETIRGGILSVDRGQAEAAASLGVSYRPMMIDIILPQAFKSILPAMVNESIALLKDSSLVSAIGALDILRRAQTVGANTYLYFEPLLFAAAIYYIMITGLTIAARNLERRMRVSD